MTQVLGIEDEPRPVMLNAPFQMNAEGVPQQMQVPEGMPLPQGAKMYDLAAGKYSVAVTVGKSFQTRLQEGAEELGTILPSLPPELQVLILPTYLRFRDAPGAKEVADLLTRFRDKQFPGIAQKEGEQPSPEQIQAQNQALQQQLQEVTAQLQQAMQKLETDAAKQQATIEKANIDAQSKARDTETKGMIDKAMEEIRMAHEVAILELEQRFEARLKHEEMAHEVAMAAAGANSMKVTRENGRDEEREDSRERTDGQSREPEAKES